MALSPASGMINWWCPSLDDSGNGTTTLNDFWSSRNGTLTNMDAATDWVAETNFGGTRALDFDGLNDYVAFNSAYFTLPFSVSLWAYCRSNSVNQVAFGIGNSASITPLFSIAFRGDVAGDPIYAQMRGTDGSSNTSAISQSGYSVNTWYHIVAAFRSTTYRQIYVNGVAGTADTTAHTVETLDRMSIGALWRTSPVAHFDGLIDDVRLFGKELSTDEIAALGTRRAYQPSVAGFTGIMSNFGRLGT